MPTLEEELAVLKNTLSLLESRQIFDVKQLNERIDALQRKIDEKEQSNDKKFERLMQVLVQHSNGMAASFDSLDTSLRQHFTSIDARFGKLEQQFDQHAQETKEQFKEIKEKFDASDHFAARTWGVVQAQEQDIRSIKSDVVIIKEQISEVRQDVNGLDVKFDRLEKLLLDRLPPTQ